MQLSKIHIENFRSIKACSINFGEINAVIGENNAGKTALLRALNSLFNWKYEEKYFMNNVHQYSTRRNTKILLTFKEVPIDKLIYSDKVNSDNELEIIFTYAYGNTTRKKTLAYVDSNHNLVILDEKFISELKADIDYVYIPAGRGSKELSWGEDSIFSRTVSSYARSLTQNRDTISNRVIQASEGLKNRVFTRLENELQKASMLESSEKYHLDFNEGIDYSVLLQYVNLNVEESGRELPIKEYGSGVKSLSVIALYRTLAKLSNVNVILGIEEPETNLHPHAQKKLIASLKTNRQDQEIQTIFATHSTVIVDELRHEDIILARRVKDSLRGFHTEYTQLSSDFWDCYHLDEYKHNNFFRYKNSDFFFSRFVIITESITDAQVVEKLIYADLGEKIFQISILNLDGVKNLKYPYFLLKNLGIPFIMVIDRDVLSTYDGTNMDESRDPVTHLPTYTSSVGDRNPVINDIWSSRSQKTVLERFLTESYTKLFDYCKTKSILVMQYCLEMDLVANEKSRKEYCNLFNVSYDEQSYKKLLIERKDAIKSPEKINELIDRLTPMEYPYSFKKIRSAIIDRISTEVMM